MWQTFETSYEDSYVYDLVGNRLHKSHHAQAAKRVGNVTTVYDDVLEEISYDYSVSDAMALNLYDRLRLETIDRTTATRPSGGGSPVTGGSLTRHSYAYDANGAQTQKSPAHWDASASQWVAEPQNVEHYRFDLRGRLAQLDNVYGRQTDTVISAGRMNSVNHYDHRNLRVQLDQDMLGANPANPYSTQTMFLVDHHNPTGYAQVLESRTDYEKVLDNGREPDVNRNLEALHSYVWGRGVISQDGHVMVTDHQGTARRTVGGWLWRYDAFGVPSDAWKVDQLFNVIPNTTENPFAHRYTGEYFDAGIGLQFNRARWYRAGSASFVSADPFDGVLTNPLTLPKYWYAAADGVNKSDPSGMLTIFDVVDIVLGRASKPEPLGVQLKEMYLSRGFLGAFVAPQLITGFYEYVKDFSYSFQDDGSIENASGSPEARHAFLIQHAINAGAAPNGQWVKVDVPPTSIYLTLPRPQSAGDPFRIQIREQAGLRFYDQASFWLGGLHDFLASGTYSIQLSEDPDNPAKLRARFKEVSMVWGWHDYVDARSALEYDWTTESAAQGVAESLVGDLIGDKLLNGDFSVIVGFRQNSVLGSWKYDPATKQVSSVAW